MNQNNEALQTSEDTNKTMERIIIPKQDYIYHERMNHKIQMV